MRRVEYRTLSSTDDKAIELPGGWFVVVLKRDGFGKVTGVGVDPVDAKTQRALVDFLTEYVVRGAWDCQ